MNMADITTTTLILVFCLVSGLHTMGIPNDDMCGIISNTTVNGYDECPQPWMVTICVAPHICSGSIIDSRHVLTAASCFTANVTRVNRTPINTRGWVFVIPRYRKNLNLENCKNNSGLVIDVSQVTFHQSQNNSLPNELDGLAILTLASPIEFNKCQRPICLPYSRRSQEEMNDCKLMLAADNVHQPETSVQLVNDVACHNVIISYMKNTAFCTTQDPRICQSQRGGVYACLRSDGRYYLHGVVLRDSEYYCYANRNVYVNVTSYLPWILSNRVPNDDLCGTLDVTHGNETSSDCPYPWMVHVCNLGRTCSGIIIDSRHVLTTTFCFTQYTENQEYFPFQPSSVYVFLRLPEKLDKDYCRQYPDFKIVTHARIYPNNQYWKIEEYPVLLTLAKPIKFDRCTRPICMTDNSQAVEDTHKCMATKAGEIYNSHREANFADDLSCAYLYDSYNHNMMLCGEHYRKICPAQRGSAFVCQKNDGKYYLYGIMLKYSEKICKYGFAVYIKVPYYLPWINKNRIPKTKRCGTVHYKRGRRTCPIPWMVNVCIPGIIFSGTIIDSRHVLTASTAFVKSKEFYNVVHRSPFPADSVFVITGSRQKLNAKNCQNNTGVRAVSKVVFHENTKSRYHDDDLAILTLESPIRFTSCLKAICMYDGRKKSLNSRCMVMRGGDRYRPLEKPLSFHTDMYCQLVISENIDYDGNRMRCLPQNKETCPAERGAAMACLEDNEEQHYLFGVSSRTSERYCHDGIAVYTVVDYYLPWINQNSVYP